MPEELSSKRNAWRSSVAEAPPLEPATAPYSSSNWLSKASTSSLNSSVPEAGTEILNVEVCELLWRVLDGAGDAVLLLEPLQLLEPC